MATFDAMAEMAKFGGPAAAGPSADFDPVAEMAKFAPAPEAAAPKEDLSQYKYDEAPDEPSTLEAVARGVKQGVTLGFGDEITGALESALTTKTYKQARDEARANDEAAKKAHRWGFGIGEVLGGAAIPVPGAGVAGVAGMAIRGAAVGAASGLGNSEADLTEGNIGGAAKDVAYGAGIGGILGAGVGAAGEKIVGGAEARSAARLAEGEGGGKVAKAIDAAHLFASPASFLAKKAGGAVIKGADEMLAKISRAANAGHPTAKFVQDALDAGISKAQVAAAVAGGDNSFNEE
jgi:hypothetical protein